MISIISDFHGVIGVVDLPEGLRLTILRREFEAILDPGKNPMRHETEEQQAWIKRVQYREKILTEKYGGSYPHKGKQYYGPETFIGWLIKEKGATKVPFCDYVMAEFD